MIQLVLDIDFMDEKLDDVLFGVVQLGDALTLVPHDKILDESKLKGFADDKIDVTQNLKFIL